MVLYRFLKASGHSKRERRKILEPQPTMERHCWQIPFGLPTAILYNKGITAAGSKLLDEALCVLRLCLLVNKCGHVVPTAAGTVQYCTIAQNPSHALSTVCYTRYLW